MRRINIQIIRPMHKAKITSCASWNCYEFLDLLRLFLTLESRVLARTNEKSMGKISCLLHRAGLAPVLVALQRWLL